MRRPATLAILVMLAACANRPQPVEFDRAAARVTTIALLDPAIPESPLLRYAGPASGASVVGVMLGPIGAMAALPAERSAHAQIQADFAATIAARPLAPRETLATGVEQAIAALGYRVVRVPQPRAMKGDAYRMEDWLESYPAALAAGADAILDVSLVAYGYSHAVRVENEQYRPMVIASWRLVRPGSGEVLMRKSYAYANGREQPDDRFAIPWMADIAKDPDRVNAGIQEGLRRAIAAVAASMK